MYLKLKYKINFLLKNWNLLESNIKIFHPYVKAFS